MKLTKAKIDEAQAVLLAIKEELKNEWATFEITPDGSCVIGVEAYGWGEGITLYDAYINAMHAKAETEPPPF